MERFLGLDVGDRRIGVAVSDPLGLTAQPVETYTRIGFGPDVRHFEALASQYDTRNIVCGLPLNMNGTEGGQAEKVRLFALQLENAGFLVCYQDERLTTVTAEEALIEADMRREKRKGKVDMVAATIILQAWLDRLNAQSALEESEDAQDDLLELEDEDGNPLTYRIASRITADGSEYCLLDEAKAGEDGDSFFVEALSDEHGMFYRSVEDEDLIERLYALYLEQTEEDG